MALPLILLTAPLITLSNPTFAKWEDYITGKGGIKWLHNCDFPGYDIGHKEIMENKCGQICMATTHINGCNAFSWQNGWCYLKKIPAYSLSRKPTARGSCGLLPWEFENNADDEPWKYAAENAEGITWATHTGERIDDGYLIESKGRVTEQLPQMKYIKNVAFNEYLFAADQVYDELNRPVVTWRSKKEGHPRYWSSTQGLWILEEGNEKNVYSIENAYRKELLFASDCPSTRYQRRVFTWRNTASFRHGHLHWQLEPVTVNTFHIKNRMFNEYLYVIEDALTSDPIRRDVHTWTQSRDVSAWAGVGDWVVETTTCPNT